MKPSPCVTRLVVAASLVATAAGCGGDAEPTPSGAVSSASRSAEATDGESTTLVGSSSCQDKRGDGKRGGDLTSVSLDSDGENLTATFKTTEPIPTSDTALFAIDVWNEAGDTGY